MTLVWYRQHNGQTENVQKDKQRYTTHTYIFKYVRVMSLINYDVVVITLLVIHLLLLAGDIELNPEPDLIENVLSIYHGNIRSLRNKVNYITNLIEELDIVFFLHRRI
jgi:hypothetical protein